MPPSPLTNLFGRSPFLGLQKHMRVVAQCAQLVPPLFEAFTAGDSDALKAAAEKINALEEEADQLKHEIRSHLPRSLFMPVARRDLLEILHTQDTIADVAQDIAGLLLLRDMSLPEAFSAPLTEMVAACVKVVDECQQVIEHLDELVEVGFRGREVEKVTEMLEELNRSEDLTDHLGITLTQMLFAHEDSLNPITVMLWYRMLEWIGDLADNAESVGNRIRLIIAR